MPDQVQFATLVTSAASVKVGWKPRRRSFRRQAYDWLKVRGEIKTPDGDWTFTDESLTVDEVALLASWLHAVAAGLPPPELHFIEPNFRFSIACASCEGSDRSAHSNPGRLIPLRITFRGEVAPPWLSGDHDAAWEAGYPLDLPATPVQLTRFAAAFEELIGAGKR